MVSVFDLWLWLWAIVGGLALVCVLGYLLMEAIYILCLWCSIRRHRGTDELEIYNKLFELIDSTTCFRVDNPYPKYMLFQVLNKKSDLFYCFEGRPWLSACGLNLEISARVRGGNICDSRYQYIVTLPLMLRGSLWRACKFRNARLNEIARKRLRANEINTRKRDMEFVLVDLSKKSPKN